ncbi:MAG: C40 family peptidase [bacterium]|nr:C40 family peptidase [bacterium]
MGNLKEKGRSASILKLIGTAKSLKGRPYKYGATTKEAPRFFDCSLFTQYVFREAGIELPRTAIDQAILGKKVALKNIKEGDLVFLKGEVGRYNKHFRDGIGHVAIYIGKGRAIHATSKRMGDIHKNILHPELIKEAGKVVVEDLNKLIRRKKPLIVIKRYI